MSDVISFALTRRYLWRISAEFNCDSAAATPQEKTEKSSLAGFVSLTTQLTVLEKTEISRQTQQTSAEWKKTRKMSELIVLFDINFPIINAIKVKEILAL